MDLLKDFKATTKTLKHRKSSPKTETSFSASSLLILPHRESLIPLKSFLRTCQLERNSLISEKENLVSNLKFLQQKLVEGGLNVASPPDDDLDGDTLSKIHKRLVDLRLQMQQMALSPQQQSHCQVVIESLESFFEKLVGLQNFMSELKMKRLKQTRSLIDFHFRPKVTLLNDKETDSKGKKNETPNPKKPMLAFPKEQRPKRTTEGPSAAKMDQMHLPREFSQTVPEDVLIQENEMLRNNFASLSSEIEEVEARLSEIGRLQNVLNENLSQQQTQIETIHQHAVESTSNVELATKEIHKASKDSKDFRWGVLIFFLLCSFSLLILDFVGSS